MLDLNKPESHDILNVCGKIEQLKHSYSELLNCDNDNLVQIYKNNKIMLGLIGMYADKHVPENKLQRTNEVLQLLYKPLTGQILITKDDFPKIDSLFNELENQCFACWVI